MVGPSAAGPSAARAALGVSPWGRLEGSRCPSLACGGRPGEQRRCGHGPEAAY
ncbi:unnamed protein product, partial [Bubo scandiacus]